MLPPVSVAIEKPTSPAAVAEPEPDDEPAASKCGFQGLRVRPRYHSNSASREWVGRELGDEHGPRIFQPLGDRRFDVDDAVAILRSAPGRGIAGIGDDVLQPPRNPVQRPTILPLSQLTVGSLRLLERELVHECHDAFEQRVVAAQTGKVELRQFDG